MKTRPYTLSLFLLVICPGFLFGQATGTTITAGAAAPATISSVSNSAPGTTVFNFDINDDASGNDAFPTLISSVVITANSTFNTVGNNWSTLIEGATLQAGANTFSSTSISSNYIEFTGIPTTAGSLGHVTDGATRNYSLKIYLKSNLGAYADFIDGLQFQFEVFQFNITLASNSSFIGGGQNANSGNANAVEVVATTLGFNFPSAPTGAALNGNFTPVIVEAADANGNRDIHFSGSNSTVRSLTNVSGAAMANGPIVGTTSFTSGLLSFASDFKFISGINGDDVTLNIRAGQTSSTICGIDFTTQALCGTSPPITLISSFESSIVGDPTFTFQTLLPYIKHQATNILNDANSIEIAKMLLVDGSRTNFPYGAFSITTNTESDGLPNIDTDGAATSLTSLTLRVTNPSNIRRIALYSGSVELAEIDVAPVAPAGTPYHDFVFTGSPLLSVPDDSQTPISVRVSFRNTWPEVTDHDPIHVSILAATLGTGSQFFFSGPTFIAGVEGGYETIDFAPLANMVNAVAAKIDFLSQPAPIAGINQPVLTGINTIRANDQFNIVDVDVNSPVMLTAAAVPVNGTFQFLNGELDISTMQYANTGDGTITISAPVPASTTVPSGLISSNTNNIVDGLPNVSIQCTHVDVLHLTASYNPNGVVISTNLVGGTANKVIFGFTFNVPTVIPGQPKIDRFTISFSNPIAGIFQNLRVFESVTPVGFPGNFATAVDITSLGLPAPFAGGPQSLTVDLSILPRDLSAQTYSYFLVVDIDPTASGTTPQMTVSLVDGGFVSSTNNNIVIWPSGLPAALDKPSSAANVQGQTYTFASIFPPTLVSSYPALAQSNVDPSQPFLELWFSVPVFSLDQMVQLVDKAAPNNFVVLPLVGPAGDYLGGNAMAIAAQPIIFNIPSGFLQPDHEYYVTTAQGVFNGTGGTGFMDQANNLFPGFVNPGTLYFRTSNYVPPKLLGTASAVVPPTPIDPHITDMSATGATLNAIFDKPGKAYFLVLAGGTTPAPTVAEIKAGVYPAMPAAIAASGNFNVTSVNPISQFGIISPIGGTFTPGQKDVWIYAESYSENNHIFTPIPNTGAYGSGANNFQAGMTGPTLQFTAPAVVTGPVTLNLPDISICNNSWQIMNSPIIISEGANSQFNGGATTQTLSIKLPSGFEFDVTLNGSAVPVYGSITLVGSDFVPVSGALSFIGDDLVRIQYVNNGTTSRDKIIISGLRVKSTMAASGSIFRFGGNGLLSFIPENTIMGTISSYDASPIDFNNSYSTDALGVYYGHPNPTMGFAVTSISDNTVPGVIVLTPYIDPATNDFGPSSFSGQGVTDNILSIMDVTLDVPFEITITHTDNNGCISQNAVEYLVYSHFTAVNISLAGLPDQGPYCSVNPNFVPDQVTQPTYGMVVREIPFNNLPGYRMETLVAAIPASADPSTTIINPFSFGGAWNLLIQSLPNLISTVNIGGRDYRSYNFDEAKILDANSISAGTLPDPYSFFRQVTEQGQTYYTGGSLGFVQFSGVFRKISNPSQVVPRNQLVEFFLPALPIVEVGQSNQPVPGTRIYCEAGGLIPINGYPAASPGTSQGRFILSDYATGFIIHDASAVPSPITHPAFIDNGTGTATLNPSQLKNGYKKILITYLFRDNNSPCYNSAFIDIQVTPNPVSVITAPSTAVCVGTTIDFHGLASTISDVSNHYIISYSWNFGEVSSPSNTATGAAVSHTFSSATIFSASLVTTSNRGCLSAPAHASLPIGGIQNASFEFTNGTLTSPFTFVNTSSVFNNDALSSATWNFGDGSPPTIYVSNFGFPASHFYATPGTYTVTLTVKSTLGCTGTTSHQVTLEPPAPSSDPPPPPPPPPTPVVTAVPGVRISEISLGDNYPNPFTGSTFIPLALPGTQEEFNVAFDLYDTQGKLIQSMAPRMMTSGVHNIEINPTQSGAPLRAGMYLFNAKVQGRSEGGVFVRKIIAE